jgi:hypothetical protein
VFEFLSDVLFLFDGDPWLQDFARQIEGDVFKTNVDKTPNIV